MLHRTPGKASVNGGYFWPSDRRRQQPLKWYNMRQWFTILNKDGYNFFFYSNEHEPIHVHVRSGSGKAKFDVTDEVQLLESKGMKVPELRKAQELAEENVETIRSK